MDLINMYQTINQVKEITGGKSITVDQITKDIFGMKICNASVQLINGGKTKDVYKNNGLNKNIVKSYSNVDSLYYNVVKGNKNYKPAKGKQNGNLGKKLVRNGNGETTYVDKAVYEELIESGKIKKTKSEANKKKTTKIRGGALLCGSVGDIFNGSNSSNTAGKKDYSKVGML
jgi:hypothetical protein